MLNLTRTIIQRARKEHLAQIAGSLTFTTVLAIVPLLAVSFALFTRFPVFARLEAVLEDLVLKNLLPAGMSRMVLKYLDQFAANAGSLSLVGTLFLLMTTLAMLLTVENAFNQIWNVKRNRPFLKRLGLYLLLLAVAPPLLATVVWAMSYGLGESMGLVRSLPPQTLLLLDFGPLLLSIAGLVVLFRFVPNTAVRWRDAIVGGVIAGVALELGKRGFAAYVLKLPTYKAVYGALAALPVFLLWVYFSWLVTLAAALIAASLGKGQERGSRATRQR
jgi:membrane protein